MIAELQKLADMGPVPYGTRGYSIWKYWHPDAGKSPERLQGVATLEAAQTVCTGEGSSFKEGDTSNWYFLGYVPNSSRTGQVVLWEKR